MSVESLLAGKDYPALERLLAGQKPKETAALWPRLSQLERLVVFKLLDASRALEVFDLLPFEDQYLLLCGFPLQAIAPVLEGLPFAQRRPFVQLPRDFQDRMFRRLAAARA